MPKHRVLPLSPGIPYYKGTNLSTLEVIKQLYDIGRLFDRVTDLSITRLAFSKIAPVELSYRGMDTNDLSPIYEDIRNTSLNISTRGLVNKEKFDLLQKGIKNIKPFMYKSQYRIEEAIADAAKAAYLATSIELGAETISHYESPDQIMDASIGKIYSTKLNKLKMNNPEAFFYWWKTEGLLSSM